VTNNENKKEKEKQTKTVCEMYATDRRQTKASLNAPTYYYGRGHNNLIVTK